MNNRCLQCGQDFGDPLQDNSEAGPGDYTFCMKCSHVMAYTLTMVLRELTRSERRALQSNPYYQEIVKANDKERRKHQH